MCLVCEKYNEDCKEVDAIHFSDRFGWVTCPNCFPKVRYSKAKYTALNKIITIKNCDEFLEQRDKIGLLSFFRRSKNKVQRASRLFALGEQTLLFNKEFKDITLLVEWNFDPSPSGRIESFYREVSLVNLIFHNREQFGYHYSNFPLKLDFNLDQESIIKIKQLIKKDYELMYRFYTLQLVINRKCRRIIDSHSLKNLQKYCFSFKH